jgi:hypothetical protein
VDGDEEVTDPGAAQRIRVDVYHHFPEGIPVTVSGGLIVDATGAIRLEMTTPPATRIKLVPGTPRHK